MASHRNQFAALARVAVLGSLVIAVPAALAGAESTGGALVPDPPVAKTLTCEDGRIGSCGIGQYLTIDGESLSEASSVEFLGKAGKRDDRKVRVRIKPKANQLTVLVPRNAKSGPVRVRSAAGRSAPQKFKVKRSRVTVNSSSNKFFVEGEPVKFDYSATAGDRIEVVRIADQEVVRSWPAEPDSTGAGSVTWNGLVDKKAARNGRYGFRVTGTSPGAITKQFSLYDHIFPIRGKHDLGQNGSNGFGGGRGHQGHDMFAACSTRVAAARGGTVLKSGFEGAAGNFVVIGLADGRSHAYMHLIRRPVVKKGDRVLTGEEIGNVGQTGRASGCRLHFEIWTAPGWYAGGKPIDPLPDLTDWDSWS